MTCLPDDTPPISHQFTETEQEQQTPAIGHKNEAFETEDALPSASLGAKKTSKDALTVSDAIMDVKCLAGSSLFKPLNSEMALSANPRESAPLMSFHREFVHMSHMEKKFGLQPQQSNAERISRWARSHCKCNLTSLLSLFVSLFPIITWLPKYRMKYLILDMISGFTIAILHIPQGMAYGILACVGAENGLYVSFFPVLIYFFLGTSKHGSIGTFAVISLMLNSAVTNNGGVSSRNYNQTQMNVTGSLNLYQSMEPPTNLEIVTSMAMGVGLWQIFMGIFQLGSLSVLLSDQLVSGFTTAAAFHVLTAQMKYLLGINVGSYSGSLKIIYMYRDIFCRITESNVATLIVSAVTIFVLAVFKDHVDNIFRKKFKMPFPIDLVALIVATVASYFGDFNNRYDINIMGDIPTGLPSPAVPRIDLLPRLLVDSLAIAMVIFAISLSMAKLFAKKHKYTVSATQELIALGGANAISSFFACFPSSISLGRSTVQETAGGQTQVAGLISCGFLLAVMLFLAPMFYNLPQCILSAVIIVALKKVLMQIKDFAKAWKISKIDSLVWLITFLASVFIDISYGLMIGVLFSLMTAILRTALPSRKFLGNIPDTDLYLDLKRYSLAKEIPGIKIFRFESALYFLNRQLFRTSIFKNVPVSCSNSISEGDQKKCDESVHHVIIDCSSFSYVDMSGLETLTEVIKEYKEAGITVLLSGCSVSLYDLMVKGNFFSDVSQEPCIFPTIHDAVGFCFHRVTNQETI